MSIELPLNTGINIPNSANKKSLQLINGKLVLVDFSGKVSPIEQKTTIINNITETKLDIFGLLQEQINNKINSLIPLIDEKVSKEEIIILFQDLQNSIENDNNILKQFIELNLKNQEINFNEKIDSNKSELDSEILDLYNLNTSLSQDITSLISSLTSTINIKEFDIKKSIQELSDKFYISIGEVYRNIKQDYALKTDLPFVPNLIAGKDIKIEELPSGDLKISSTAQFLSHGGGTSQSKVQEMIDTSIKGISTGSGGSSGASSWGSITGTLSTQTDLQSALNNKSDVTVVAAISAGLDSRTTNNTNNIATLQLSASANANNIATLQLSASANSTNIITLQNNSLNKNNNLLDVTNISAARNNLGLDSFNEARWEIEDFYNNTNIYLGLASSNSNGSSNTTIAPSDGTRLGIISITTGAVSAATSRGGFAQNLTSQIMGNGFENFYGFGFNITSIGTSADGTIVHMGLHQSAGGESGNAIGFRCSSIGTQTIVCYCRASSVETVYDTGILFSAGWQDMSFWVNSTRNSVKFYSGTTLLTTITTNIPSAAMGVKMMITRLTANTNNYSCSCDYFAYGRKYDMSIQRFPNFSNSF